jgi:hypothetical protein
MKNMNGSFGSESKMKSKVIEMLLSSPGMNEKCKVVLSLSRENIIFFSRLIEVALLSEGKQVDDDILNVVSKNSLEEFRQVQEEILKKGDLTDFYQKLKTL